MKQMFHHLHAGERGTPCEAAAHRLEHDQIAFLDPAVAAGDVEGERHRGGRGVGVLVDRDNDLFGRQVELARGRIEDACIGLVRHDPVDIGSLRPCIHQNFAQHVGKVHDRMAEDLAALHAQLADLAGRRGPAVDIEQVAMRTVGMQLGGQDTRTVFGNVDGTQVFLRGAAYDLLPYTRDNVARVELK